MDSRKASNGVGVGVAGVFLQATGFYVQRAHEWLCAGALLYVIGTGLLLAGLMAFATAKGRSPAWGVLAFLSFAGLVVLVALKDAAAEEAADGEPDTGERLIERAAGLDFAGQWDDAVALFERVLAEPSYHEHHAYARNSIARIREKRSFGDEGG